jgi:gliding motility-associated-like protein
VKVYNKWGNLVFESKGYANPWDGTHKGKLLEPATYYYFIDLANGDPIYQGYVIILK